MKLLVCFNVVVMRQGRSIKFSEGQEFPPAPLARQRQVNEVSGPKLYSRHQFCFNQVAYNYCMFMIVQPKTKRLMM